MAALVELSQAGISTYAFVGPLLPHFVWQEGQMKKLLQAIKVAGAKYVYVEHLNLTPTIKKRLFEFLEKDHPKLLEKFAESTKAEYRDKLDKIIHQLLKELGLPLAHERVLYHPSNFKIH